MQKCAERGINIVKTIMERLRMYVMENPFANEAEEIHFFREVKPRFTSKLIEYMKLYRLETNKPVGDARLLKKFLKGELKELQETFNRHRAFYQYYRSGATFLDNKYFLRNGQDIHLMPDPQYLVLDTAFHTTHDYIVSELIANEKFSEYLTEELKKLQGKGHALPGKTVPGKKMLTWTAPKAALYELIYAVFSDGAINNGNAEIKEIANVFGEGFNIDVSQVYRAGQELRIRKSSRTKYLKRLIERVENRWNEQDETPRF